jgi:FkbM family methyltransferase
LQQKPIRTVIDIGANTGQFAIEIHALLPRARIYSFEPLQDSYGELVANMRGVSGFVGFNVALGDRDGHTEMYRHTFTPSSSLLHSSALLHSVFPQVGQGQEETIVIRRLDAVATELRIEDELLVKIDVQGYEDRVILGGQHVLSRASFLIVETSFVSLYDGQPLFDDVYKILSHMGFRYRGNVDQLVSPLDGMVLQADALFTRDRPT